MSVLERQSWYVLGVLAVVLVAYLAVGAVLGFRPGSSGMLGFLGLIGLTPLIGRRERRSGRVVTDERDADIARRASLAAYGVFWLCFVAVCMAPFFVRGPHASVTVSTTLPPRLAMAGMALVFGVRSLAVVLLYRR